MEQEIKRGPLLEHLDEIEKKTLLGDISLKDLFFIFGKDGHFVLILFFILPFLQPIPLFGLSTPFGILIAVVAVRSYLNKPPWIPARWENKKLSAKTVLKIAEGSQSLFEKLSFMLHPRWTTIFNEPFKTISMILIVFNALLLALPLPIPFSNSIPAWMIFFQALGQVEEDGLFILFSYLMTIVCIVYFGLIVIGAGTGLEKLGF